MCCMSMGGAGFSWAMAMSVASELIPKNMNKSFQFNIVLLQDASDRGPSTSYSPSQLDALESGKWGLRFAPRCCARDRQDSHPHRTLVSVLPSVEREILRKQLIVNGLRR